MNKTDKELDLTEVDLGGEPLVLDDEGPALVDDSKVGQGGTLVDDDSKVGQGGTLVDDSKVGQGGLLSEAGYSEWDLSEDNKEITGLASILEVEHDIPTVMVRQAAINLSQSATLIVKAGLELTIAKSRCQHGEFMDLCDGIGVSKQRASEAMRYAKYASQIPADQLDRYLTLPKKSALLLGSADPSVIQFLLEDDQLDATRRIRTTTQLKEIVHELNETEDALKKTADENVLLHDQVAGLKADLQRAEAGSDQPVEVVLLRKESAILADEALACISSIKTYEERYQSMAYLLPVEEEEKLKQAAVYPALSNLASVARSALLLFQEMAEKNRIDVADIATFTVGFDATELDVIEAARLSMLDRKKERAIDRTEAYATQGLLKRKPGRQQAPA